MPIRATPIGRSIVGALVAGLGTSACYDDVRPSWVLSDDPVVMGISLAVVEDGPYAAGLASLPADRPRAEVLPLDVVELDAFVADADGLLPLDDAAWMLCGAGCLSSLEEQGQRFGELPDCHEGSLVEAYACLAGRGERPHVVIPDLVLRDELPLTFDWSLYPRVLLVSGRAGGPSTDACLDQLVLGPRIDLTGCAIGTSDLAYGPAWVTGDLLSAAGYPDQGSPQLPPSEVLELLPPNTAAVFEQVEITTVPSVEAWLSDSLDDEEPSLFSIDEVLEVDAGAVLVVEPVISPRDQQLVLAPSGPNAWLGRFETHSYQLWTDEPEGAELTWGVALIADGFLVEAPTSEQTFHVYVKVTDRPGNAVSWFTLTLRVVAR